MIRITISIVLCLLVVSQKDPGFDAFVKSFEVFKTSSTIDFGKYFETGNEILKDDAVRFIYSGDSTSLFCLQRNIDMETEKAETPHRSLFLPRRLFRIEYPMFTLLCYETYQCDNSNYLVYGLINIEVVNKKSKRLSRLVVQRSSDFDTDLAGLLNPQNGRIFLLSVDDVNKKFKVARMLKLNPKSLAFETELTVGQLKCNIDYPSKVLDTLNWSEKFKSTN